MLVPNKQTCRSNRFSIATTIWWPKNKFRTLFSPQRIQLFSLDRQPPEGWLSVDAQPSSFLPRETIELKCHQHIHAFDFCEQISYTTNHLSLVRVQMHLKPMFHATVAYVQNWKTCIPSSTHFQFDNPLAATRLQRQRRDLNNQMQTSSCNHSLNEFGCH